MDGLFRKVNEEIKMWSDCVPTPIHLDFSTPALEVISWRICDMLEIDENIVMSKSREKDVAFARQLIQSTAMAFSRSGRAGWSLKEIGEAFGNRKHCTVIWSSNQISNAIDSNYKINKIREAADLFDLTLSDYKYSPLNL